MRVFCLDVVHFVVKVSRISDRASFQLILLCQFLHGVGALAPSHPVRYTNRKPMFSLIPPVCSVSLLIWAVSVGVITSHLENNDALWTCFMTRLSASRCVVFPTPSVGLQESTIEVTHAVKNGKRAVKRRIYNGRTKEIIKACQCKRLRAFLKDLKCI